MRPLAARLGVAGLEVESELGRLEESIEVKDLTGTAIARAPITRERTPAPPKLAPRPVRFATRHAKAIIAVWALLAIPLAVVGLFAPKVLHAEDLIIRGTPSAAALKADQKAFGVNSPVTIMLTGPAAALDASGPALVDRLNQIKGVSAASPWSAGAPNVMREQPDRALIVVSANKDLIDTGRDVLPKVQAQLDKLPSSITSNVAGQARFSTELVDLVFSGALKAEILAFPFLLLILLLIFRAPIAAAMPLVQGLAVIGLTTGFVTLLGLLMPVNILAQASGSIIGLALGVDYSLLFVQRFRDELRNGKTTEQAVSDSLSTAGRTVTFAGGILVLAGLIVMAVSFGWASMTTGSIGVVAAAVFSVLAALTLLPACLSLLGPNIDKWAIGKVDKPSRVAPLVNRIINRPMLASVLTLIPLLALCAAAFTLKTGGPDLKMFKSDNPMRVATEAVAKQYGGGVMAPYEVIATSSDLPLTSPKDVKAISSFQNTVAQDPAVRYVIGLGNNRVSDVSKATEETPAKLYAGLGAASSGAKQNEKGLKTAAAASSQLAAANNQALGGAQTLASGLAAAQAGSSTLSSGLGKAASGAGQLDSAMAKLRSGAHELRLGSRTARSSASGFKKGVTLLATLAGNTTAAINNISSGNSQATAAIDQAIAAIDSLPAADQSDPGVQSARSSLSSARGSVGEVSGVSTARAANERVRGAISLASEWSDRAVDGAGQLDSGVAKLQDGVGDIAASSGKLTSGLTQLSGGSNQLKNGLSPLAGGSQQLASGLGAMAGGSNDLAKGLSSGSKKSSRLTKGLASGSASLEELKKQADEQGEVSAKKVGKSPYLTMALLSAAPEDQKRNLNLVLNEKNGGTATRAYVFTDDLPTDKSLNGFDERLVGTSSTLAKATGASVAVGGAGRTFLDYDGFTKHRIWILLGFLSLMSFLFLLVVFRSVLLAAKAVVLNLITVGAAMGLITLLYGGGNPLFGGPGWMEATSFFVVYSVTFALSMDYEIFMINRMRESYVKTGSNERAIRDGVTKTASIVTGSALVMCVLFAAMAYTSELVSQAQLGLGLAFAIAIDATVVRLVLLPATMRLFGDANWWMPSWLERVTPNVAIH